MKDKMINTAHVEGYVYSHKLEKKIAGPNSKNPGTEYIRGTLDIATVEDASNVVSVFYTYETRVRNSGAANGNFDILEKIITGEYPNVMDSGIENAKKIRLDSAIGVNDFYDKEGKLVSAQRLEGGFLHEVDKLNEDINKRSTFECNVILGKATRVEADEEKKLPEKVTLKGYIFNFRKEILPVSFSVFEPAAMDYFEGLDLSDKNPVFTKVRGNMDCLQVTTTKIEEGAFGDHVVEYTNTRKNFTVTWTEKEPKEWDTEETILATEMIKLLQDREVKLAAVKKNQEEYAKGNAAITSAAPVNSSTFNF